MINIDKKNPIQDKMKDFQYLKENIYPKLRRKISVVSFKAGYDMMKQIYKDLKAMRILASRELHGVLLIRELNDNKNNDSHNFSVNTNQNYIWVFPKKSNVLLEMNDLNINNLPSDSYFNKNYIYLVRILIVENWESHMFYVFRFIKQFPNKNINNSINNNSISYNSKGNFIENKMDWNYNFEGKNFIDNVLSLYSDISDNSTKKVNEIYTDLSEKELERFCEVFEVFTKKLKVFVQKNLNIYLCNESILINRSLNQILNYILSCKAFSSERFKITKIIKGNDSVEIFVEIKDKFVKNSNYQTKFCIQSLSEISCYVLIMHMIDIKIFDLENRLIRLKTYTNYVLKTLKKKLENELIVDNSYQEEDEEKK